MKNLNLLFVFSIVIILASCTPPTIEEQLQGDWNLTSFEYTGQTEVTGFPNLTTDIVGSGDNFNFTWNFNDGVATSEGTYDVTQTSTTDGNSQTTEEKIDEEEKKYDYIIVEETITLVGSNGSSQDYSIVEITNNKLVLNSVTTTTTVISMSTTNLNLILTK